MITAPAWRSLATWNASCAGRNPAKVMLPLVVAMSNVSNRFLTTIGMPSSAPFAPFLRAVSAARAWSIALLATISYEWKPNWPVS